MDPVTEVERAVLLRAVEFAHESFLRSWDLYIRFYVAFSSLNLIAVGVVVNQDLSDPFLAGGFIIMNLMSGTALKMGTNSVRHSVWVAKSLKLAGAPEAYGLEPVPVSVAKHSGIANFIGHVVFIIIWLGLVIKGGGA